MPFNKEIHGLILSRVKKMELHDKIKFVRLSQNLTQGYVADELNIDVANYSRLERGETSISTDRLSKIASILEVNITNLLEDDKSEEAIDITKIMQQYLAEILEELKSINNKLNK